MNSDDEIPKKENAKNIKYSLPKLKKKLNQSENQIL